MQENHSFDNYFGTFPGADGIPAGTCMPNSRTDPKAGCVTPFHIGGKAIIDLGSLGRVEIGDNTTATLTCTPG